MRVYIDWMANIGACTYFYCNCYCCTYCIITYYRHSNKNLIVARTHAKFPQCTHALAIFLQSIIHTILFPLSFSSTVIVIDRETLAHIDSNILPLPHFPLFHDEGSSGHTLKQMNPAMTAPIIGPSMCST